MTKQVHVRMEQKMYTDLFKYSNQSDQTMQDIITKAVGNMLADEQKKHRDKKDFTFIDLFAGIGGIRIAMEANGGHCVFSSEWDKYCQKTYYENFGDMPQGDITQIEAADVPDHDVLVGGFPCQPFSLAGVSKKNSLGRATGFLDETQGTLFFDVVRILKEKRPKAFLLENVKNLRSHDKGKTWKVIQEALDELNYEVSSKVINGKGFTPQNRERIFIVGFDRERFGDDINFDFDDVKHPDNQPVLRDILEEEVEEKYTLSDKLWSYLQGYAEKHRAKGNGFGFGMPDLDSTSRTLSARYYKDGSEILIKQEGQNPRKLTPRECARLQGFPDEFLIPVSNTQAYKQFGNSVVVPLVTVVAESMIKKLNQLEMEKESDKRVLNSSNTGS